jgi:hypothetical protein
MVLEKYESQCDDDDYDRVIDVNKDGKIDVFDSIEISGYCGSDGTWCMDRLNDQNDPCVSTTSTSTTTILQAGTTSTTSTTTTIPCSPESCNELFTIASENYKKRCDDDGYNFRVDIDKDAKIDMFDTTEILSYCGSDGTWCEEKLADTYDPCPHTTTTTTTTLPCPPQICQNLLDRVKRNYGKKCGDSRYDPVADVNKDKKIDIFDTTEVSDYCGSDGEWCEARFRDTTSPCVSTQELTENCVNKCSRRYPIFWCRFTCGVSCSFGFC